MRKGQRASVETRKKISVALTGRHFSAQHLANMSADRLGKTFSPEHKAKMSAAQKKRFCNPSEKAKISASLVGNKRRLGHKFTDAQKAKISVAGMGRPCKPETRAKLSASNSGEKSANWKGGLSFEPYCPKWNDDLRRRIRAFFDHRCVLCGKPQNENITKTGRTVKLHCHHVNYSKSACCDGEPVHFAALCHSCHSHTNYARERWEAMLHRIIDEIYDGRSYFTKEAWKEVVKCR